MDVAGIKQRTRTIDGGGDACSWLQDDGEGELLQFEVETQSIPPVTVSCFDDDGAGNADDEIGEHVLHLHGRERDEPWSLGLEDELWLPLKNSKHKEAGECRVSVEWIAQPAQCENRLLVVTVLEADGLPKQDRFGQNDPYCACSVNGAIERTKTVEGGGASPVWGFGSGEELQFQLQTAWVPTITFSVFDEDEGSRDDFIGGCDLRPNQESRDADQQWSREEQLQLVDKHGHAAGRLHVLIQWDPSPGQIDTDTQNRLFGVTLFHAHVDPDLRKRGERLYCAVSAHGTNERTGQSNDGADGIVSWGEPRPGYEQLEYLQRQQEGLRLEGALGPDAALLALTNAPPHLIDDVEHTGQLAAPRRDPQSRAVVAIASTQSVGGLDEADAALLAGGTGRDRLYITELWEFSQHLGIQCVREPHLLWIAEEAMGCKLPRGWEAVEQRDGTTYYAHPVLNLTQWEHPLDDYFEALIKRAREAADETIRAMDDR